MITGNSQPHDDRGDQQPVGDGVAVLAVRPRDRRRRSGRAAAPGTSTLSGAGRKRRSSAKTVERHDAEHGDLAQGVEAAEVDQDDVDDVGAAAFGVGVLEEVAARAVRAAAASSPRRRAPPCPAPAATAMREVAQAARRA